MAEHQLRFDEFFALPRERVFDWFADHEKLGRLWGARFKRIQPGTDPATPNGVGSVREIRAGAFKFEETIVTFKPHQLIEYQVTKGGPIKNHLARMVFNDAPGGTRLEYTIDFDSKLPGTGGLLAATLRLSWKVGLNKAVRDMS
jgi:uncharacterized protein YndB with AHSA1/START domain